MLDGHRHATLTDNHFYYSVLQSLPADQMTLDDEVPFVPPMSESRDVWAKRINGADTLAVTEPDKSRAVFVHARQKCSRIRLPE